MNGKKQLYGRKLTVRVTPAQALHLHLTRTTAEGETRWQNDSEVLRGILDRDKASMTARSTEEVERLYSRLQREGITAAMALLIVGIFLGIVIACALIKTGVL